MNGASQAKFNSSNADGSIFFYRRNEKERLRKGEFLSGGSRIKLWCAKKFCGWDDSFEQVNREF
jgi:hypothetical protein